MILSEKQLTTITEINSNYNKGKALLDQAVADKNTVIKGLYKKGFTPTEIARLLGMKRQNVSALINKS